MKTIFIALFTLLLFFSGAPSRVVTVNTGIYTVKYSEEHQQPLQVSYRVLCTETKASRAGMDFYTCDSIRTSDAADYVGNVWDKGHMAPAAAFSCSREMLQKTFSYLNCALQHEQLNRGAWRLLESHERKLAETNQVRVTIVIHFSDKSTRLPSGATVPDGFTKSISWGTKVEKYYFPNARPEKSGYASYLVTDK